MKNYRYLKYAQYACILIIVLFLIYVVGLSSMYHQTYEELLSGNPLVITGFMICTANLYVWWVLKHFNEDVLNLEHIESMRINLIVLAICQFFLMNFVSTILIDPFAREVFPLGSVFLEEVTARAERRWTAVCADHDAGRHVVVCRTRLYPFLCDQRLRE